MVVHVWIIASLDSGMRNATLPEDPGRRRGELGQTLQNMPLFQDAIWACAEVARAKSAMVGSIVVWLMRGTSSRSATLRTA